MQNKRHDLSGRAPPGGAGIQRQPNGAMARIAFGHEPHAATGQIANLDIEQCTGSCFEGEASSADGARDAESPMGDVAQAAVRYVQPPTLAGSNGDQARCQATTLVGVDNGKDRRTRVRITVECNGVDRLIVNDQPRLGSGRQRQRQSMQPRRTPSDRVGNGMAEALVIPGADPDSLGCDGEVLRDTPRESGEGENRALGS